MSAMSFLKFFKQKINEAMSDKVDGFGIPLLEMAVDRQQFKTKIEEKFLGAIREKTFVELAKRNGKTKWVEHKQTEVDRLVFELLEVFDLSTKGSWDKARAAIEAINYHYKKFYSYIRSASRYYEIYYKEKPVKLITPAPIEKFTNDIIKLIEHRTRDFED